MTSENTHCAECGMVLLDPAEYHPYAACAMYKQWQDSHAVRVNLKSIMQHGRGTAGPPSGLTEQELRTTGRLLQGLDKQPSNEPGGAPIDCPTCGQPHVDEAAIELRKKLSAQKPAHAPEDDFLHFLSYEQLSRQPPDELDRLRLAYYAGADAPRPAKTPRSIVQGADFVLEPADGMGRALYVKEGGGLREWNKLTQQQRAEWTIRARTLGEVCPRCQQTMPGGVTLHTHHCPALKSGDDHG